MRDSDAHFILKGVVKVIWYQRNKFVTANAPIASEWNCDKTLFNF